MQGCVSSTLLRSRWDKEDTSSSGSSVLWLLLLRPIHLPVVTLASGFLPILLPSCPPSKHTHSLIPSLPHSPTLFFPVWPPGRCVALKQALLIEHLFRHGAGSVACGRAAGGSSRGDIMSYYISWYVSFTCVPARFTGTHSHSHSATQTHATAILATIIVVVLLENVRKPCCFLQERF